MSRVILAGLLLLSACTYSDGERTGVVTKLSHKGWLCKTWEGELQMLGVGVGGQMFPGQMWEFSVRDPSIATQIQEAQQNGTPVTLHYEQYIPHSPCAQGTEYNIVRVEHRKEGS